MQTQILTLSKQLSKICILKAMGKSFKNVFLSLYLFNLYYFECMHDVIYEAESALCNINKHHLQLYRDVSVELKTKYLKNCEILLKVKNI